MKKPVLFSTLAAVALFAPLAAQQPGPAPVQVPSAAAAPAAAVAPLRVYLRGGLKTHGEGQHDYPQFVADWSKILTDRGAIVDGGLHFPTREELSGVDVIVSYKGDSGYMTADEKATLEGFLKRGGGLVGFHDTICGEASSMEWFSSIYGGAKQHGQVNYTLEADVPYTVVDKANPIMQGFPDNVSISDEAFYLMTWAKSPQINVLANAKIAATPTAVNAGHAGEMVPQMWTYERTSQLGGQPYRAFVWMQGHTYSNFVNPAIQNMLLRAIAWTGKRPVDSLLTVRPARGGGGGRGGRAGAAGAPAGAPAAGPAGAPAGAGGQGAGRGRGN